MQSVKIDSVCQSKTLASHQWSVDLNNYVSNEAKRSQFQAVSACKLIALLFVYGLLILLLSATVHGIFKVELNNILHKI